MRIVYGHFAQPCPGGTPFHFSKEQKNTANSTNLCNLFLLPCPLLSHCVQPHDHDQAPPVLVHPVLLLPQCSAAPSPPKPIPILMFPESAHWLAGSDGRCGLWLWWSLASTASDLVTAELSPLRRQ